MSKFHDEVPRVVYYLTDFLSGVLSPGQYRKSQFNAAPAFFLPTRVSQFFPGTGWLQRLLHTLSIAHKQPHFTLRELSPGATKTSPHIPELHPSPGLNLRFHRIIAVAGTPENFSHPSHQKNGYCKNPSPESFKSQYQNLLQIPRKLTPEKIRKSPKLNPDLLEKSPQRSPQKS